MSTLIKQATIVTMDDALGEIPAGDILIEDCTISAIAPALSVEGAQVIDGTDLIAMPGFVNGHLHLWQTALRGVGGDWTLGRYFDTLIGRAVPNYRPEDVFSGNLAGALDQINSGVTTLVDWCHMVNTPEHADAAVDALDASGIRAVFAYGTPMTILLDPGAPHPRDARRMRSERLASDTGLITMALAIRGPDFAPGTAEHDLRLARELGVHASFHVACGKFGPRSESILELEQAGLLGPSVNVVHANFLSPGEFASLARCGASVAITPEVEMQMGLGLPPTGAARDSGTRIALGTDVVAAVSTDMFSQMRFALQTERALRNDELHRQERMPEQLQLRIRDVLAMATIESARAFGLDDRAGSLTPGKSADITLVRKSDINMIGARDPVAAIVLHANPGNVDTVLIAGEVRKKNGRSTYPDHARAMQALMSSSERLHAAIFA